MKKLLKNKICGSVNSAQYALIGWKLFYKSNFAATIHAQCINSSHNSKICPKTREKKKEQKNTNANTNTSAKPKRTLSDEFLIWMYSKISSKLCSSPSFHCVFENYSFTSLFSNSNIAWDLTKVTLMTISSELFLLVLVDTAKS